MRTESLQTASPRADLLHAPLQTKQPLDHSVAHPSELRTAPALQVARAQLAAGESLHAAEAEAALSAVLTLAAGPDAPLQTDGEVASYLTLLAQKSPTVAELVGSARALRARMRAVPGGAAALCPCGTGGSGKPTFSTSTAVAFVLAGLGVPVAKHGNRSASGRCGSADTLAKLGVPLDLTPEAAAARLQRDGLVFLFAPRFHPALGPLAPLRAALGVPTIFNAIGPLCNPAQVQHQVLGVPGAARARTTAHALAQLGTARSAVVAGHCGLDEVSLSAPSLLVTVVGQQVHEHEVAPNDFGLPQWQEADVQGGSADHNAQLLLQVLQGHDSPHAQLVCANAAVALWLQQRAPTLREATLLASHALRSGLAKQALLRAQQELS